jgi:hypothetical protein
VGGAAGVIHASGVLRDAMLARQHAGGVRGVMAPKVSAAARLEATVSGGLNPLAAAVMFSSIAALLGSTGQAGKCAHWFKFQLD